MTFTFKIERLKNQIQNKIAYTFLEEHTQTRKISLNKLKILTVMMERSSLPKNLKEDYTIATMLVEIALNTHEQVQENSDITNGHSDSLTKQLSVLGGDYYSSLYYVLLSQIKDLSFTQYLATAIKEVNELKMDFHFKASDEIAEYIKARQNIESYIIKSVAQYIDCTDSDLLSYFEIILLIDLLIEEKRNFEKNNIFNYFTQKDIQQRLAKEIDYIISNYQQKLNLVSIQLNRENQDELNILFEKIINYNLAYMEEG